jgi:hypothetical protein
MPYNVRTRPTAASLALGMALVTLVAARCPAADGIAAAAGALDAGYRQKLEELARGCDQRNQADAARHLRAWAQPGSARELRYFSLPEAAGWDQPADAGTAAAPAWRAELIALRKSQAERLWELARQAARDRSFSLAYELLNRTLRENPDHEPARRILGYQLREGRWLRPFALAKRKAGQVWHEKYGWIAQQHLPRYEAGERMNKGRWISAAEDERLHRQIDTGWEIETEHFTVTTNHSLEAAVELGQKLERLHEVWHQAFPAYYLPATEIVRRFEGAAVASRAYKRHQVVYFRSQDEYQRVLRGAIPENVTTTGIYLGDRRTAYFFAPEPAAGGALPSAAAADDTTLFHEAAHQLFSESRSVAPEIGRQANFWIVEGIACYFESLTQHEGYQSLGGIAAERVQGARFRRLKDGFYVPLEELTAMGMLSLQRDERIARLYSQSAGLADFLMHQGGGQYRDVLTAYLLAVYTGRDRPGTLAALAGASYEQLDRQYEEYLRLDDSALADWRPPGGLKYLILAGSRISDAGLKQLSGLTSLSYLDLAETPITDAGLAHLRPLQSLRSLDVRNTRVSPTAAAALEQAIPGLTVAR